MKPIHKIIPENGVTINRIGGRNVIEANKPVTTVTTEPIINYPLTWCRPRKSGANIVFGPGVGYATGLKPSNEGTAFGAGSRICMVETITPTVTLASWMEASPMQGIFVSSIDTTCVLSVIPSPFKSQGWKLRYPAACQSEIKITVLGYLGPGGSIAIAEKVLYDDGLGGTFYSLCRYPYYLSPSITGSVATEAASRYYYNEQEILDDPDL